MKRSFLGATLAVSMAFSGQIDEEDAVDTATIPDSSLIKSTVSPCAPNLSQQELWRDVGICRAAIAGLRTFHENLRPKKNPFILPPSSLVEPHSLLPASTECVTPSITGSQTSDTLYACPSVPQLECLQSNVNNKAIKSAIAEVIRGVREAGNALTTLITVQPTASCFALEERSYYQEQIKVKLGTDYQELFKKWPPFTL